MRRMRRVLASLSVGLLLALAVAPASSDDALPLVVHVALPGVLTAGTPGALRVAFRATQANVVALVLVTEDLDGARRSTTQREFNVLARAFGLEAGDLVVPVVFPTPGLKRITVTLLTDQRQESDPVSIDVDVLP